MVDMIISFFGPDGVGKSTVGNKLAALGWVIFSGTNVSSWPDQTWHEYFVSQGLDESKIDDNAHFLEKIRRVHHMARQLTIDNEYVVIDSDPVHKTLMHDHKKQSTSADFNQRMVDRLKELTELAGYAETKVGQRLHVHFAVSDSLSDEDQAVVLHERLSQRTDLNHFDPKSVEESLSLVRAARYTSGLLTSAGERVVTIHTDREYDGQELLRLIGKPA